jgi:hypothetical protein
MTQAWNRARIPVLYGGEAALPAHIKPEGGSVSETISVYFLLKKGAYAESCRVLEI